MMFPQHKTDAGYLVCISDLGGEPQGNGSARILYETNTELKRRIYDNTIVIYTYCDVRHPPSTKAGFNMNLIAVLNINQSAYEPKKLTQRRSMVRWQKNITSQTAKKNMKVPSLSDTSATTVFWKKEQHKTNVSNLNSNLKHDIWNLLHRNTHHFFEKEKKQKWSRNKQATRAQPTFLERDSNSKQMLAISTSTLLLTYETFSMGHGHIFSFIDEKIWSSDRDATPTQPTAPKQTEQHGSDIGYFKHRVD